MEITEGSQTIGLIVLFLCFFVPFIYFIIEDFKIQKKWRLLNYNDAVFASLSIGIIFMIIAAIIGLATGWWNMTGTAYEEPRCYGPNVCD